MLSKPWVVENVFATYDSKPYIGNNQALTIINKDATETGDIVIDAIYTKVSPEVYINDVKVYSKSYTSGSGSFNTTLTLNTGDNLKYKCNNTAYTTINVNEARQYVNIVQKMPTDAVKKDKIFELKPIGKKATAILFGKLPTGERWDGN